MQWRSKSCSCLEHQASKAWEKATGSYVVDMRRVWDAKGASSYLGKYLVKEMYHREELVRLGFHRRWSCSRNWPRDAFVQLRGSADGEWVKSGFTQEDLEWLVEESKNDPLMDPVGSGLALQMHNNVIRKMQLAQVRRTVDELIPTNNLST